MNKKILAAAVAGALAVPGLAFAQAGGVTISGTIAVGIGQQKITSVNFGGPVGRGTAAVPFNTKGTRINDEVSVLTFGIVEPLGGGMDAFGQLQFRPCADGNNQGGGFMTTCSSFAETFVGLRNVRSWGQLRMGSITLAGTAGAGRGGDLTAGTASADMLSTTGTMQGTGIAPSTGTAAAAISNAPVNFFSGRVPSSIQWVSPNWSGFNVRAGYSTSGPIADGDLGTALRKGSFWTISPEYIASNWNVGLTYVDSKPDSTARDMTALQVWGTVKFGSLRTSLVWGHLEATNRGAATAASAAGILNTATGMTTGCAVAVGSSTNPYTCSDKLADANRWMITADYTMGPHVFAAAYVRVNDDKVIPGDTAAKAFNVAYAYKLSNRTSLGLGYVRVTNGAQAAYPITGAGGSYLEPGAALNNGEDASWFGAGIKHTF